MSEIQSFMSRDGLVQNSLKVAGRHAKWTGSSLLNLVLNLVLALALVTGYNTVSDSDTGPQLSRLGDTVSFVSAEAATEDEAATVTVLQGDEEVVYQETFDGFVDTVSFETVDENMVDYLKRCQKFAAFNKYDVADKDGPIHQVKTTLPKLVW